MLKIHMKQNINLNDSKAFIEYLNDMDDIYKILKYTPQTRNA